jgi:hypothetical protein
VALGIDLAHQPGKGQMPYQLLALWLLHFLETWSLTFAAGAIPHQT